MWPSTDPIGPLQDPGNLHRAKVAKPGLEAHIPWLELLVRRTEYGKACCAQL